MSELEKLVKNIVYGGVGMVAAAAECGAELASSFVDKGREACQAGAERMEELKQQLKEACEEAASHQLPDVSRLTRAQRDELRSILDRMDEMETAQAAAEDICADIEMDPDEEAPETDAPEAAPAAEAPEAAEADDAETPDTSCDAAPEKPQPIML